ncbi:hypothetical protein [Neptuniibacter caesariensis]|uniref:Uncharacterized protein n=1 Tax=Neptuniibacter caesariensis TaxID=207954 RepID=A0A7U8C1T1_NEPCE|nr:hypothetical protein [Neptuniibacter caesariensis]EAR59928.1 hypothetical protein MED92_15995 [Oceanospirillum sp. MED92] [Neptuniibacter caesariensis]
MKIINTLSALLILLLSLHASGECLSEECDRDCQERLLALDEGMLDFCEAPSFGTYSLEKNGITWYFDQPVTYGKYVNGDFWVLDKGTGVTIKKVTPIPNDGVNGSMVNPTVGAQAYDADIYAYKSNLAVKFPVLLNGGDSLVSTISKTENDLNQYDRVFPSWYRSTKGLGHAELMGASVLTVVSQVPKIGSFRPPYIGNNKVSYNVSDIDKTYYKKIKSPSYMPNVSYYERGLERPWLMHLPGWTARKMHPVENMPNYHREVGNFLSDASLILLTDKATEKLLYRYIQTGIDHYYTIINGSADSATFEFQSIFTGLLLKDDDMASVWKDGQSKTLGRAADKFYFYSNRTSSISSNLNKNNGSWNGYKVLFRKKHGTTEHDHLHPSEWKQVTNGGGIKQETYRLCCDSKPHFGMALASRIIGAEKYWPSNALDLYLDRWIDESLNGSGLETIRLYYPTFKYGTRKYVLGSKFLDSVYKSYYGDWNNASTSTQDESYIQNSDTLNLRRQ